MQLEYRKYGNSEEITKKTLQEFKKDHSQILQTLKIQHTGYCNRTDSSAEYSFVPNSKEQSSIENSNKNVSAKNNTGNVGSPRIKQTLASPVVDDNRNYTSVQSSEQLLNSVVNNEQSHNANQGDEHNGFDIEMEEGFDSANDDLPCIEMNDKSNSDENSHIFKNNDKVNENKTNNDEDMNEFETSSIDSDVAEALTQIVEEYSAKNETTSQLSSDVMSVDEDLLTETVNEINEELSSGLISVENIVLTPPLTFRDT